MINKFNKLLFERELIEQKNNNNLKNEFSKSIYSIETLENSEILEGHEECVNTINFNENGSYLVSGSDDETVKIWNFETKTCVDTLYGHTTNVFAANFLPYNDNKKIISGGNDADIRYYDTVNSSCTVFKHHNKKVLKLSVNPIQPDTFLSCSSDGTVRLFDIRLKYKDTEIQPLQRKDQNGTSTTTSTSSASSRLNSFRNVLPQVIGGGRTTSLSSNNNNSGDSGSSDNNDSLLINFDITPRRAGITSYQFRNSISIPKTTIFSVEYHPFDGYSFITTASDGSVRLFDQRYIADHSSSSFVNIYRNLELPYPTECEATGCAFSRDGNELVVTYLSDQIYLYNIKKNYSKEFSLDYFKDYSKKKKRSIHSRGRRSTSNNNDSSSSSGSDEKRKKKSRDKKKAKTNEDKEDTEEKEEEEEEEEEEEKEEKKEEEESTNETTTTTTTVNRVEEVEEKEEEEKSTSEKEEEEEQVEEQGEERELSVIFDYYQQLLQEAIINGSDGDESSSEEEENDEDNDNESSSEYDYYDESDDEEKEGEEEEEVNPNIPKTYIQKYSGHTSVQTIKSCNFYGPNSEYVISGSDDAKLFIWDKESGKIVRILDGHQSHINSVIYNPEQPCIASAGIDSEILLWEPTGHYPEQIELERRQKSIKFYSTFTNSSQAQLRPTRGRNRNSSVINCANQ